MEFLLFGGWVFWAVVAGVLLLLTALVENMRTGWATLLLVGTVPALEVFSDLKPITYAASNPVAVAKFAFAYLLASVTWGIVRWTMFVYHVRDKVAEAEKNFLVTHGVSKLADLDPQDIERWNRRRAEAVRANSESHGFVPQIADHKGYFYAWMMFWPVSLAWTMVNDPVRRFYNFVYNRLAGLLQGISDRAFEKFEG